MWVIFVNISPVMGPVIHEERKAPACRPSLPAWSTRTTPLVDLLSDWAFRCWTTTWSSCPVVAGRTVLAVAYDQSVSWWAA